MRTRGRAPAVPLALGAVLAGGCAASSASTREELKAQCDADLKHDPRCLEVLTTEEGYETREHVLRAEEDREADAFRARLQRLRNAEEERQGARGRVSSSTGAIAGPSSDGGSTPIGDLLRTDWDGDGAEGETGSSVRALRAVPVAGGERTEALGPERRALPHPRGDAPTPESYLRAARCLLVNSEARIRADLEREKASSGDRRVSRERQGALALAIVETSALLSSIETEIAHRGLPRGPAADNCGAAGLEEVGVLLGRVAGPGVGTAGVDGDEAGLVRLRQELEVRAGLPRRP